MYRHLLLLAYTSFIACAFFVFVPQVFGATFNDAANGNWNIGTTWGGACSSSCAVGTDYPGVSDTVTINSHTVTMTQSEAATTLNLSSGGTFAIESQTVTVSGVITVSSGTNVTSNGGTLKGGRILLNGGTFAGAGAITIEKTAVNSETGSGGNTFNNDVTIKMGASSGNLILTNSNANTFNGNIVLENSSTGALTFGSGTGVSTLASGKTVTIGPNGFTAGTLNFTNFVQTGSTAQRLVFPAGNTVVLNFNSGTTFNGAVTSTSSSRLFFNGATFGAGGTFGKTGASTDTSTGGNTFNGDVSFTLYGGGAVLTSTNANAFNGNLVLDNTSNGTLTLGSGAGVNTLASGKTVTIGSNGFGGGTLTFANFVQSGSTAQTLMLNGVGSLLSFSSGTTFNGNVTATAVRFFLNGSTFNGTFSLTKTGVASEVSTGGNTFNGDVSITNSGGGATTLANTNGDTYAANLTLSGTLTISSNSTQTFNKSSGIQTLDTGGRTFPKLTHSGEGTLKLVTNNLTVNSALTNSAGTIDLNGKNLTTTSATFSNTGTIQLIGSETITGLTQDAAKGTWKYVGDGDGAADTYTLIDFGSTDYFNLIVATTDGADIVSSGGAKVLAGSVTITSGTLDANNQTFSINGDTTINGGTFKTGTSAVTFGDAGGDSVTVSSGTLLVQSTNTQTGIVKNAGTWTNSGGTISYSADSTVSTKLLSALSPYFNLAINSSGSTYTLDGVITINGDLTNTAGTIDVDNSGNYGINSLGNWSNSGIFTARSGTVTLSGTTKQTISGNLTGGSAFYNLTITNNSGTSASDDERTSFVPSVDFDVAATITNNFVATTANTRIEYNSGSTYTFANINWNGQASGSRIYFRNSAASGAWNLNVSGTQTAVSYINVSRSDATAGSQIVASDGTNYSGGNNTNWAFFDLPGAPTGLTPIAGNGQVSLSWTAPVSDGGSVITDYVVEYKLSVDISWSIFADGTSVLTTATVVGLTNTSTYDFRVSAVNDVGQGSASTPVSETPIAPLTTPGAPTSVSATSGNAQATVSFTAPVSDGGSTITSYTVTSSPGGLTGTGTSSPIVVSGLTNGTAYTFTVVATNAVGDGSASDPSNSVTPATIPGAPTGLTPTAGNGQVSLSWTAPVFDGGTSTTDYVVEYKLSTDSSWSIFADGTSALTTATVTGLSNALLYDFRVSTVNAVGQGDPSSLASATPVTVPDAPTGATAVRGNAQATISFTPPVFNGGTSITSYTVTSSPGGLTGTGTSSPIVVSGLTNGTAYTFTVVATNAVGDGSASDPSNSVTPATIPGAPTSASATPGNAQATVSFTAPVSDGGSAITSYTVTSSPGGFTGTGSASPIVVTGLTNGTSYTFTVTATNDVGTGSASSPSNSVTLATPPGIPVNLAATVGGGSVSLSWSAPSSDGGSAITDYIVEYQLTTGGTWSIFADGTSALTTATVSGLSNDNSYDFRVSAVNIIGQGSASATTIATPGEPAQVLIQSFPDLTVTSIGTAVRITNEGSIAYEYQYTWCVTDAVNNLCGGGNDIFSSTAAKLIQPSENWDTTLNSTVSTPGNYWFHIEVLFGSDSSSANQSFTAAPTTPGAPTSASATAGNAQATISFSPPSSNGGSAITSYTVTSSPGGFTGTGSASPIVVTGLTNGTSYTFTVTATNIIGVGDISSSTDSITPVTVPGAPTGLTPTVGDSQIVLAWIAPIFTGGTAITDYVVEYKLSSDSVWIVFSDGVSTLTNSTVTGLVNGLSYDFRVSAVNVVGQSDFNTAANSGTVTPPSSGGGGAPYNGSYTSPISPAPPVVTPSTSTVPVSTKQDTSLDKKPTPTPSKTSKPISEQTNGTDSGKVVKPTSILSEPTERTQIITKPVVSAIPEKSSYTWFWPVVIVLSLSSISLLLIVILYRMYRNQQERRPY